MQASLFPTRGRGTTAAGILAVAGLATIGAAIGAAGSPTSEPWDPAATREVEAAYHQLHDLWNKLDIEALKGRIAGDTVLPTFDFDANNTPVRLASKQAIDRFTEQIFSGLKREGVTSLAVHPTIACRATAQVGICTEECRVQLVARDGSKTIQPLRASAVAVRGASGWRWIQWHMSPGGPLEHYDAAGRPRK